MLKWIGFKMLWSITTLRCIFPSLNIVSNDDSEQCLKICKKKIIRMLFRPSSCDEGQNGAVLMFSPLLSIKMTRWLPEQTRQLTLRQNDKRIKCKLGERFDSVCFLSSCYWFYLFQNPPCLNYHYSDFTKKR